MYLLRLPLAVLLTMAKTLPGIVFCIAASFSRLTHVPSPANRLLPPHDPAFSQRPTSKYLLEDALERIARSSESDSVHSGGQQPSGQDPLRRPRVHNRHDGEPLPLDGGNPRLNSLGINTRAVPVSPSADPSGSQPIRNRHQPLPLLNMSPTNEKSLALAAAIAQANGLVLQRDPSRPSTSHHPPSPVTPIIHYHISPAPEYPSPPPSIHSSPYPSGVSAAIQEALDSLHQPQASSQHLRVVAGTPFTVPASLPGTPVLIASFPTTPFGVTQPIYPTGGEDCPSPMTVPAGQSPYLKPRLVAPQVASNMDFYPQGNASPSREFRDDEGFQMDLDEHVTVPDYPEDDIVQIAPLEVYQPPPSTMPRSAPNIISSQAPTRPLATKSSKGHPLELDISGLARRLTSSTQKSSTKSLPPGIVPSFSADSPSTAPATAAEPSPHANSGSSGMTPHRLLRKAQSQSRMRETPASGASSLSSQSSLSWIGGSSAGSGGSSRLPGLPRRQKSFQNPASLPVPVPIISSSFPGLRHAVSFNQSAVSGSPPEEKSKGKEKEKVEKEKGTSPRKRFFNSSKYSSGNSMVLDMEYAGLIGKMHEAEASLATQRYDPSLKVEISSPINTHDPPPPRLQHTRPRSAPAQRMYSRSPSRSPLFVPLPSTSPPNGQTVMLDDEWASHFSSPITVSTLIIHEAAAPSALRTGGVVPGTSPPLLKQMSEDNTSTSPRESPTTSVFSVRVEERRAPRQHIIPPSELLRLGEEAREHTSALHSPPSLSRGRTPGASLEYPAMSGFAPNGTPVGFAALRARSTSTSRLPSDSATLASPILGANRIRSHRTGSAGTSISTLGRPFGAYASGSISSTAIDLRGATPTRSLSVLSKASSLQSFSAARARRPSTAGSLQMATPLNPLVGFSSPNGGAQSLPPPPRPRLTSLRTGGSIVHGPGHSPSARTSTSTDLVSPISTLTSAPTLSSGVSWSRTTSSPNISRPPSSASLSHPLPGHPSSVVAGASQRQRSVSKKPSFLEIGDEDDDASRINGQEGEVAVSDRSRMSRTSTNTNTASRTSSRQSFTGGRSRAPSSASVGRSVHKVPSKASLKAHQQAVSVPQSESFLELDIGNMTMGTIRQHPDELELGENEHVHSYRY